MSGAGRCDCDWYQSRGRHAVSRVMAVATDFGGCSSALAKARAGLGSTPLCIGSGCRQSCWWNQPAHFGHTSRFRLVPIGNLASAPGLGPTFRCVARAVGVGRALRAGKFCDCRIFRRHSDPIFPRSFYTPWLCVCLSLIWPCLCWAFFHSSPVHLASRSTTRRPVSTAWTSTWCSSARGPACPSGGVASRPSARCSLCPRTTR